jgi:hypothetical protein
MGTVLRIGAALNEENNEEAANMDAARAVTCWPS